MIIGTVYAVPKREFSSPASDYLHLLASVGKF